MLIDLDQSTLAYMTATLEGVCKKIPPERDSNELRKKIADALIASAKAYRRTLADFEEAGMQALGENDQGAAIRNLLKFFRRDQVD